jgi:hypothetical protein
MIITQSYFKHKFRRGTVPFTRKRKASRRYWRYPQTRAEIRDNEAAILDLKKEDVPHSAYPRKKRCRRMLPTLWDDKNGWPRDRNWKNFRKHQWKEK